MTAVAFTSNNWDWFSSQLDRLSGRHEAFEFLKRIAAAASFRHIAMLRLASEAEFRLSRQLIFTTVPHSVVRDFEAHGLAEGSRAIAAVRRSSRPFVWSASGARTSDARSARGILEREGVVSGVTVPLQTWRGLRGLVLFGGGESRPPDFGEVARLAVIGNAVFERLTEIEGRETSTADYRISGRERQCLVWTAAGKTSAEIASILGLSEHTVNQYITSSCQKLGATNRTQAAVKALRVGIID